MKAISTTLVPRDLTRFRHIVGLDIAPDGKQVAVEVVASDRDADMNVNEVWSIDTQTGSISRVAPDLHSVRRPRFSPDGGSLAFLGDPKLPWGQDLYTMDLETRVVRRVAGLPRGVLDYAWSPDSRAFALTGYPPYPPDRYRGVAGDPRQARAWYVSRARVVDRLKYQWDGRGLLDSEPAQIWVCSASGSGLRQVTNGRAETSRPRWLPNGQLACLGELPERDLGRADQIWTADPSTGDTRLLWEDGRDILSFAVAPNGTMAVIAEGRRGMPYNCHLDLYVDGRCATAALDRTVTNRLGAESEIMVQDAIDPAWSADSSRVYFQVSDRASVHLYRLDVRTNELGPVISGERMVATFAVGGGMIAFASTSDADPLSIRIVTEAGDDERILWEPNAWLVDLTLGDVVDLSFNAHGWEVDGWALTPPRGVPRRGAVVLVHGGPQSGFAHSFSFQRQMIAAAGYTVLYCNPPGSNGRDEAYMHLLVGKWGELDLPVQEAFVDIARQRGVIGPAAPGITGVSYAGYFVLWAACFSDRFAAVVASRPTTNFISKYGDDWSWRYSATNLGAEPWEDPDLYRRLSLTDYVTKISIPVRFVVALEDRRCPPEQAQQIYAVLKKLGRRVDMVLMPDAPHYQHAARPWHRVFEIEATIEWFDRYLVMDE